MAKTKRHFAAVAAVCIVMAGCGNADSSSSQDGGEGITVWSLEAEPARLAIAQAAARDFTEKSGIEVEVVGISEDQFPNLIATSAAAGTMPDVVGALTIAGAQMMAVNDLVNTEATAEVINNLGPDTFSASALALSRNGEQQVMVPSDGSVTAIVYRKDLFAEAGLPAPKTYADLLNASETLNSPEVAGVLAPTDPDTNFTRQVFEHFALANGCDLVSSSGEITIDSKQCVDTMEFYGNLVKNFSVPGAQDTTSIKTTYMAGDAAMMTWGSGVLDELAGLVNDAMPTCSECASDPQFIAKNSGFVWTLQGPNGQAPSTGGELTGFVIPASAEADPAKQFVQYFLDEGYLPWLSQTPEGKLPFRLGTADDPQKFVEGWKGLSSGVDTRAKLPEIYPGEVLSEMLDGMGELDRWGFTQGQGDLVGAELPELVFARAVAAVSTGDLDAKSAIDQVKNEVQEIQDSMQ